jgi:hypothetical protein
MSIKHTPNKQYSTNPNAQVIGMGNIYRPIKTLANQNRNWSKRYSAIMVRVTAILAPS